MSVGYQKGGNGIAKILQLVMELFFLAIRSKLQKDYFKFQGFSLFPSAMRHKISISFSDGILEKLNAWKQRRNS